MAKVRVISVGKVKQSFIREGEAEYTKRLRPYLDLSIEELGISHPASLSPAEVMKQEAKAFKRKLTGGLFVALDEKGKSYNSLQFSGWLEARIEQHQQISFGIGGAFGWDESIQQEAGELLSLSSLTFPYQLTRLILVEQIYRAVSLTKGLPYHKQ